MTLRINSEAPDFTANTTRGEISFHDWIGDGWAILFSHPKDFTPVCTTELGYTAKLKDEFAKRGVKVMGLSVDPLSGHEAWAKDIEETQGAKLNFPLIADDRTVASLYGMIHPNADDTMTVRSVFVIGPDKKLKLSMTYPMNVGRNFAEVLRALDGLQTAARENVATPANWTVGDDVVIPTAVSDEDAKAKYGAFETVLPYLRMTKLPG